MRKLSRGETWILALTLLFAASMTALYFHDIRSAPESGYTVTTEKQAENESRPAAAVNVNTASAEELTALDGIGEVLAGRIIAYRTAHGPFRSVEELTEVEGIGESKLDAIRGEITVKEATP